MSLEKNIFFKYINDTYRIITIKGRNVTYKKYLCCFYFLEITRGFQYKTYYYKNGFKNELNGYVEDRVEDILVMTDHDRTYCYNLTNEEVCFECEDKFQFMDTAWGKSVVSKEPYEITRADEFYRKYLHLNLPVNY